MTNSLPSQSMVKHFLEGAKVAVSEQAFQEVWTDVEKMDDASSIDKVSYIVENLTDRSCTVSHASIRTISITELPCLVFTNKCWGRLLYDGQALWLKTDVGEPQQFQDISDVSPGLAFWLTSTEKETRQDEKESPSAFSMIFTAAFRKKRWVADIAVATICVNVFALVASLYAMQVYDRVVPTLAFQTLTTLSFGLIIIYVFDFFLKRMRSKILDSVAADVDDEVSAKVYNHLLKTRLDSLPSQLGTLTAKISGIESARQFFSSSIVFVLIDFPFAFLFLSAIALIGGWVAAIYALFLIISVVIGFVYQSRSRKLVKSVQSRSNERMGVLVDTIKGLETIKTAGLENDRTNVWQELSVAISDPSLAQKHLTSKATTFSSFLSQVAYASAVVAGVLQVAEGSMTVGSMIAVSILGGRVLGPCGQVVSLLLQYENTKQSISLVDQVLALPVDLDEKKSTFPNYRPHSVVVEDLKYQHANTQVPQLSIQKLAFRSGDRVALLGPIGAGKSTLLKVLAGLYAPTEGFVKVNNVDLWSIDRKYLHNHFAYLSQSPLLVKGSLKSNLTMDRNISEVRFNDVFQALGIDKIVQKSEKGLDLEIHEGGTGLSGGQRQLISLARIFLGKSSVWLFDEPTASLDPETQSIVLNAINTIIPSDDIVIIATHNPKFATDFSNRIIILRDGQIEKDVPTERVQLRRRAS